MESIISFDFYTGFEQFYFYFSFYFFFSFFALAVRLLSYELQTRMSVDTAFSTLHIS